MKKRLLYVVVLLLCISPIYSQDSDNDGVLNAVDLDDDNDGILDKDECGVILSFDNISSLTAVDLTDLKINEKILYTDAVTVNNNTYDIVLTVTGMDLRHANSKVFISPTYNTISMSKASYPDDEYFTFKLSLVEKGSATPTVPDGISATINNFVLELRDIDSAQDGFGLLNFTDCIGYLKGQPNTPDSHALSGNTNLENEGFRATYGPGTSYEYFRMDPRSTGAVGNWFDEIDYTGNGSEYGNYTVFLSFSTFSSVDLVFGVVGNGNLDRITVFGSQAGCDTDGDGVINRYDIDSDDDGIPDNVEAQPTIGYVSPTGTIDANGVPTDYVGSPIDIQDTDNDGLKDFVDTDTDADGIPDIEENGMANAVMPLDTDSDGLDDNFEGSNTNDVDVNDEIDNPQSSVLPDSNGDVLTGGDLDYRDIINFTESTIDFDGVDDYVSSNIEMKNYRELTVMAWMKLDTDFVNEGTILGENIFSLYVDSERKLKLKAIIEPNGSSSNVNHTLITEPLNKNQWYHVTGVFNGNSGEISLYLNGRSGLALDDLGKSKLSPTAATATSSFAIGRLSDPVGSYFKGAIDEVRIFNKALTVSQIQKMMHQEIVDQGGYVKGKIIPKIINDANTNEKISWSNLQAYYPMTTISTSQTSDESGNGRVATLHNITTIQKQTAPMPFTTTAEGSWEDPTSWVNGNVTGINDMQNWSIVKLDHNTTTNASRSTSGLIIGPNVELKVTGNNAITNTWHLGLDGTIDLENDSQLIQGEESNLVTSATGKILRRQEGSNNKYWYNYWASPIGAQSATALNSDENSSTTNNINNTSFKLNALKDQDNNAIAFTNSLHEQGKVSNRWLYTFKGGTGYPGWIKLSNTTDLNAGEGYCHKGTGNTVGTGNTATLQGYLFEGKPNNGTVALDVAVSGETLSAKYLVGNPYPSAIDARQFINDNSSVIEGTLYFWEQWAGNTHVLSQYEGGYGTVNLTATVKAYQYNNSNLRGRKTPTFNIPVGQGFFVKVQNTGKVVFRNSQRVFANENNGDSVFMRQTDENQNTQAEASNNPDMDVIRLEFSSSEGTNRELVIAFSDQTTDGYDNGYDGKMRGGLKANDLCTKLDDKPMVIQAYSPISPNKEVNLVLKTTNDNLLYSIKMLETSNIDANQQVYLRDNSTDTYFNLRDANAVYNFSSNTIGEDSERFSLVFKSKPKVSEEITDDTLVYIKDNKLYLRNVNTHAVKSIHIINMYGNQVKVYDGLNYQNLSGGIQIPELNTGAYVIKIASNTRTIYKIVMIP